jgi:hypothetical protein
MGPIIVSGLPRSGTTWMQWFLSQHPRIHIHGQEPRGLKEDKLVGVSWDILLDFYDKMIDGSKWAEHSNATPELVKYPIPHYAGNSPHNCKKIFAKMVEDFLCGFAPRKPRWGIKSLRLVCKQKSINKISSIWPDVKWIVCIRDPFISFESQRNTFVENQNLGEWIQQWIDCVKNIEINNFYYVQIDKLNGDITNRQRVLRKALLYIEEEPTKETEVFIEKFPIVHKAKPDNLRKYKLPLKDRTEMLNKHSDLGGLMQKMGYEVNNG